MKNRAKCKLCQNIIESFHRQDYVTCPCGEISIDGGNDFLGCRSNNFDNFLRVDDEGNEIVVKYENKSESDEKPNEHKRLCRDELLSLLDDMIKTIESLPQQALFSPISHYDHLSLLYLISSIFRAS